MDEVIKKTILWLDDDFKTPALRTEKDELLRRNYSIIATDNPDAFMEALSKEDFDCIVMDITLPLGSLIKPGEAKRGMRTGLVILNSIIANEELSSVPIVVYTIVEDQDVKEFCKKYNVLYISKLDAMPWTLAKQLDNLLTGNSDENE